MISVEKGTSQLTSPVHYRGSPKTFVVGVGVS